VTQGYRKKIACQLSAISEGGARRARELARHRATRAREEGRALPYLSVREDHFRFPGARAHEPRPDIRGRHENDLGSR
jgi:hypothetical protein